MTKKILCANQEKFSLENPKELEKSQLFSWKLSKFSKYIGQGVPLPPLQTNFIADLDELEHAKKIKISCENVNNLGWPPPTVVKIHKFFFSNDNLLKYSPYSVLYRTSLIVIEVIYILIKLYCNCDLCI